MRTITGVVACALMSVLVSAAIAVPVSAAQPATCAEFKAQFAEALRAARSTFPVPAAYELRRKVGDNQVFGFGGGGGVIGNLKCKEDDGFTSVELQIFADSYAEAQMTSLTTAFADVAQVVTCLFAAKDSCKADFDAMMKLARDKMGAALPGILGSRIKTLILLDKFVARYTVYVDE